MNKFSTGLSHHNLLVREGMATGSRDIFRLALCDNTCHLSLLIGARSIGHDMVHKAGVASYLLLKDGRKGAEQSEQTDTNGGIAVDQLTQQGCGVCVCVCVVCVCVCVFCFCLCVCCLCMLFVCVCVCVFSSVVCFPPCGCVFLCVYAVCVCVCSGAARR